MGGSTSATTVATAVWAAAALGCFHQQSWEAGFTDAIVQHADYFTPGDIANVVWGYARWAAAHMRAGGEVPSAGRVMEIMREASLQRLGKFDAPAAAAVLAGCAALRYYEVG